MQIFHYFFPAFTILLQVSTCTEIVNNQNETILRYENGNQLEVLNLHHPKKTFLKLSLSNETIEKTGKENDTNSWKFNLKDGQLIEFTSQRTGNVTHQILHWTGGAKMGKSPEMCFHYSANNASWYGGYQSMNQSFPLNVHQRLPKQPFNYLLDFDRFNSRHVHSKESLLIQEHLFLNSDGFALLLDSHSPLFIRRDSDQEPQLCLSTDTSFPFNYTQNDPSYQNLKVHIFSANNIRTVLDYVTNISGLLPKPKIIPDVTSFSTIHWFTWELDESSKHGLLNLSHNIQNHGFPKQNNFLIFGFLSSSLEYITNNSRLFPQSDLLETLHSAKQQFGIQILTPNVNTHDQSIRGFINYCPKYCIPRTSLIDFSNLEAARFYAQKLANIRRNRSLDYLHLSASFSLTTLRHLKDSSTQRYPNDLTTKYIESVSLVSNVTTISEYAFNTQHLPIWTRLTNGYNVPDEQLLSQLIANLLSVSLAGYSFLLPYSAGGFRWNHRPSEEIYIRTVQASTFMPAMSFTKAPWSYSERVLNITRKYVSLHLEHVPTIVALAGERITSGRPIVRPLWYSNAEDPKTFPISDQFMLGDDILVAPVITVGQQERSVYLPAGIWIDPKGAEFKGPGQIKVAAPLEELPYFKRKH